MTDDGMKLTLDEQLCFALYSATNAVTRSYQSRLDSVGLTYPQYLVLLVLWQDGPSSADHIQRRLSIASEEVSTILGRLEKVGFLTLTPEQDDATIKHVDLTDEGRMLEQAVLLQQRQVVCETGLSDTSLGALRSDLKALVARMAEVQTETP